MMERIVASHLPDLRKDLAREALKLFYEIREVPGLKKKPATSELIDWLKLLMADEIPVDGAALQRSQGGDPAAAWRAAEERAGCASVRAHRLPAPRDSQG